MPFTPAHAAAALPLRKSRFCFAAVIVGTLSPDFEYFFRLSGYGFYGHTALGIVALDLPLAFSVLVLFNRYVRHALPSIWPTLFVRPSQPAVGDGLRLDARTALLLLFAILVGALTHILWDSFTHPVFWPYQHFSFLKRVWYPLRGHPVQTYKVLQHASTLAGLSLLFLASFRRGKRVEGLRSLLPSLHGAALALAAVLLTVVRVSVGVLQWPGPFHPEAFASQSVVTFITALWVEVVLYGVWLRRPHP